MNRQLTNDIGDFADLNGNIISSGGLMFDPETYHFWLGQTDVTQSISRADKLRLVDDFDVKQENFRISSEKGHYTPGGIKPLEESTATVFGEQILTDPLAAPGEALSNTINRAIANPAFKKGAIILLVGVGLYFALKKSL